jgi:xanthine dehydrogenase YagT iron-sulfur-binding subunit
MSAQNPDAAKEDRLLPVTMVVNGEKRELRVDPRLSLLDCLREILHLTGTKKGCDHGQCGACTVHINGRRANSCLALAAVQDGREIVTIEGLGSPGRLHPMQAAFLEHDAYQCGYCTSGQIMSAVALLKEPCGATDDDVREFMSGNICRCGAYSTSLPPCSRSEEPNRKKVSRETVRAGARDGPRRCYCRRGGFSHGSAGGQHPLSRGRDYAC